MPGLFFVPESILDTPHRGMRSGDERNTGFRSNIRDDPRKPK